MSVDYNVLAEKYDLTRTANIDILNRFAEETSLDSKTILDFGCGTGNFAFALCKLTTANVYGLEPSDGMREKAAAKGIDVRKGDHSGIPYDDNFFDFIYMTDVIHHVPDLNAMFTEFMRILKPGGLVCILTESHEQLATRFWVKYFPTTVAVERGRYPDIPEIVNAAKNARLSVHKSITTDHESSLTITDEFICLVENKGYSMFHLIKETDYQSGLAALRKDYGERVLLTNTHGETMLWLKKGSGVADITYSNDLTVEQYNNLRKSVGWNPIEASLAQKGLEHTAFPIVASDGLVPVGMARVITDYGYQVLIADVIVHPDYQGKGIGGEIMSRVMEYINGSIAPGQRKMINLMSALGKDGFYKKYGFAEHPNEQSGPGMTQWISKE